jgi:hypothetical protein
MLGGKPSEEKLKSENVEGRSPERRIVVGLKRTDVSRSSISEDIQSEETRS